jgi:hypothetical protein
MVPDATHLAAPLGLPIRPPPLKDEETGSSSSSGKFQIRPPIETEDGGEYSNSYSDSYASKSSSESRSDSSSSASSDSDEPADDEGETLRSSTGSFHGHPQKPQRSPSPRKRPVPHSVNSTAVVNRQAHQDNQQPAYTQVYGIERPVTKTGVTYTHRRLSSSDFNLELDSEPLFNAHCSAFLKKSKFVVTDLEKRQEIGFIIVTDKKKTFTFRANDGRDIAIANFWFPRGNTLCARRLRCQGYDEKGSRCLFLRNRRPEVMANGARGLFFGGRLTLSSVKNAILIDMKTQTEIIGVRKIATNILELDAWSTIKPAHIFTVGMAAWLGP